MKKGAIIIIGIILAATAIATYLAVTIFSAKLASSLSVEITFKDKHLMEDKLYFDSEKHFLENGLLVAGAYAAYKNGENGTIYNDAWPRLRGTDFSGNPYDYACWLDWTQAALFPPPLSQVTEHLGNRINDTYEDYLLNLEHTEMKDHTPLEMNIVNEEMNLSYKISELNLTGDFLNHTMKEKNIWINTTIPIRYLMIYGHAFSFANFPTVRTQVTNVFVNVLDEVTICNKTGYGIIDTNWAKNELENILRTVESNLNGLYPDSEWELHLLEMHLERPDPSADPYLYTLNYTAVVNVRDSDPERRVATTEEPKKVAITFAIKDTTFFIRTVNKICDLCSDCTGSQSCGDPGISPWCDGNDRIWWSNEGASNSGALDDCSSTDCYCEKKVDCNPDTCCSGSCVDTDTDENNCGSCGNPCGGGQICESGSCRDQTCSEQGPCWCWDANNCDLFPMTNCIGSSYECTAPDCCCCI